MATGAYDEDIAGVLEALAEEGQLCQWVKQGIALTDAAKPWLGGTPQDVHHDVNIVFVSPSLRVFNTTTFKLAVEAGEVTVAGFMGPSPDFVPVPGESLLRGDSPPLVLNVLDTIQPAEDVVFYILGLK